MNLTQLAKHLNLSTSTVSRALNGYTDVNPDTRQRVIDAASALGYQPNPLSVRLRLGRTGAIGVLLTPPQRHFADPFFLELIQGIDDTMQTQGLDMLVAPIHSGDDEIAVFRRFVEGRRVDGLIFARTRSEDDPRIAYLQDRDFPFATLGRSKTRQPFAFVDIDHGEAGRLATARLIALGHKRIALISSPLSLTYSTHRLAGYHETLKKAGLPQPPDYLIETAMDEEHGFEAASRLLDMPEPPTALVCANDLMAMGAMFALQARGLRAGGAVSVIGCDDVPQGRLIDPPLTTISAPIRDAGRQLGAFLLAAMDGGSAAELQNVWQPTLVARGSDGPPQH